MYSASRSLMARISDKVKGPGFWAQLTGQFAVEEMISVTRACRSTGVGRAMVFPPSYCRSPPNLQIPAGRGNSAASTDTKELRAVHTPPIEQRRPTFAVADSRTVLDGGGCHGLLPHPSG